MKRTSLFKDQLVLAGEAGAKIVLGNLILAEKMSLAATRLFNARKPSMLVKVKNSAYTIKHTHNRAKDEPVASKTIQT